MLDDESLPDVEEEWCATGDGHDEMPVVCRDADLDLLQPAPGGDPFAGQSRGSFRCGARGTQVGGDRRGLGRDGAGLEPDTELHHAEHEKQQGGQQDRPLGRLGHPALVHGRGSFADT